MKVISVTSTETAVASGGNRRFIHMMNNSNVVIYVKYDGDATALTTANGFPLLAGAVLQINNDGHRNLFDQPVTAIVSSGTAELRVHGE